MNQSKVDEMLTHCITHQVYQFTCKYRSRYIKQTERWLFTGILDHVPWNSIFRVDDSFTSAIAHHIMDTEHQVSTLETLKIGNRQILSSLVLAGTIIMKQMRQLVSSKENKSHLLNTSFRLFQNVIFSPL
ncbi:unnamed protein product [Heterobilharzia americana]|nr:unnamed protein product [Heterobilharzia americana]